MLTKNLNMHTEKKKDVNNKKCFSNQKINKFQYFNSYTFFFFFKLKVGIYMRFGNETFPIDDNTLRKYYTIRIYILIIFCLIFRCESSPR